MKAAVESIGVGRCEVQLEAGRLRLMLSGDHYKQRVASSTVTVNTTQLKVKGGAAGVAGDEQRVAGSTVSTNTRFLNATTKLEVKGGAAGVAGAGAAAARAVLELEVMAAVRTAGFSAETWKGS